MLHGTGPVCNELMLRTMPRMTLFTGSQAVADKLTRDMKGRVKLEDAGFDWKILGPDVAEPDYVAWQCDQDAYVSFSRSIDHIRCCSSDRPSTCVSFLFLSFSFLFV